MQTAATKAASQPRYDAVIFDLDGTLLHTLPDLVAVCNMVLEELGWPDVVMVDCPIAEGAVAASLSSLLGDDLETVKRQAMDAGKAAKW